MTAGAPLVVHVIHRLDFGGLENGLVNLVTRMPQDRYRHAIVCLAGVNSGFRTRIRRADVEIRTLDKRPGKDVGVYARMWRTLRSLQPDIVHTRNLGTVDMQWVAAAARVPHRVHGEHGWEATDPTGRGLKNLWIRRACRPVVHRYVPMSQDIARWLERDVRVDPSRIRQLYSGVDTERFAPGIVPASTGTEGPRTGLLTIGTVGRLDPVKDQAILLQAFAALQSRVPDARLVIVGDGPLRGTLRTLATSLGIADAVTFTGARDDTPDLLRAMDVFVLPSVNEGISNTILEAMATGLPVVARRVGGNPELVVDGATGALYDGAGPQGLEEALARYLTNPSLRQAHGRAARERAVQCFSLDAMVQRYLALYDELLLARSSPGRQRARARAI
jgi:sugar transferase (PEP-CTERM/EpsH1 system associated)